MNTEIKPGEVHNDGDCVYRSMTRKFRVQITSDDNRFIAEASSVAEALRLAYEKCKAEKWHPQSITVQQDNDEGNWETTGKHATS